jgi:CRISPR/Cas system-associated exonuclease Cas4 (RecB family)
MAAIPPPLHGTVRSIFKLHEDRADRKPRAYLGASQLGEPCARRLWLSFRWAGAETFGGRMLRLFDTGVREEARLIDELRAIGVQVEGQQFEVSAFGGHLAGHLDGAVLGLEEAPRTWHVMECKTHKAKLYAEVVAKGVEASKPVHFAQLQVYMGLTEMPRAAYFSVCKDTDEIDLQRVEFDQAAFDKLMTKAKDIIFAAEPPARISDDPAWFQCRFCPFRDYCHGEKVAAMSCRTCAHSTPQAAGGWRCEHHGAELDEPTQRAGCGEHRFIPALLERVAELVAADGNKIRWRNKLTGRTFDQPGYDSAELAAAQDFRVIGDDYVQEFKAVFGPGTRVVEPSAARVEVLRWQTFKNGKRHIRRDVDGAFAGYAQQTPEILARIKAAGDPQYPGSDEQFVDDIPWSGDGQGGTESGDSGAAKRPRKTAGGQRRLPVV